MDLKSLLGVRREFPFVFEGSASSSSIVSQSRRAVLKQYAKKLYQSVEGGKDYKNEKVILEGEEKEDEDVIAERYEGAEEVEDYGGEGNEEQTGEPELTGQGVYGHQSSSFVEDHQTSIKLSKSSESFGKGEESAESGISNYQRPRRTSSLFNMKTMNEGYSNIKENVFKLDELRHSNIPADDSKFGVSSNSSTQVTRDVCKGIEISSLGSLELCLKEAVCLRKLTLENQMENREKPDRLLEDTIGESSRRSNNLTVLKSLSMELHGGLEGCLKAAAEHLQEQQQQQQEQQQKQVSDLKRWSGRSTTASSKAPTLSARFVQISKHSNQSSGIPSVYSRELQKSIQRAESDLSYLENNPTLRSLSRQYSETTTTSWNGGEYENGTIKRFPSKKMLSMEEALQREIENRSSSPKPTV